MTALLQDVIREVMSPSGWQNLSDLTSLVLTIQNGGSLFYVLACTEKGTQKGTRILVSRLIKFP